MDMRGRHLVIDAFDCDSATLDDVDLLERLLTEVVTRLGMQILSTQFHRFDPQGVTGVLVLSTSHISIHTWPEHNYAALDIYTCGDNEPATEVENLLKGLSSTRGIVYNLTRAERKGCAPSIWEVVPDYPKKNVSFPSNQLRGNDYDQLSLKDIKNSNHRIVYQENSKYQEALIIEAKDTRLYLDKQLQFSSLDERRYHEALVHPAFTFADSHERVLILGGGDGLALREVLKYESVKRVDLVEIDPMMIHLSRNIPEIQMLNEKSLHDERVTVHEQDANQFLMSNRSCYDVIIIDFPDPADEEISKLYTKEFYQHVSQNLTSRGVIVCQSFSPLDAPSVFWSIALTLQSSGYYTRSYHATVPTFGIWGFHLASNYPLVQRMDSPALPNLTLPENLSKMFVFPDHIIQAQKIARENTLEELTLHQLYQKEIWTTE